MRWACWAGWVLGLSACGEEALYVFPAGATAGEQIAWVRFGVGEARVSLDRFDGLGLRLEPPARTGEHVGLFRTQDFFRGYGTAHQAPRNAFGLVARPPGRCQLPALQAPHWIREGDRCPMPPFVPFEVWTMGPEGPRRSGPEVEDELFNVVSWSADGEPTCSRSPEPAGVPRVCRLGDARWSRMQPSTLAVLSDGTIHAFNDGYRFMVPPGEAAGDEVALPEPLRLDQSVPFGERVALVEEPAPLESIERARVSLMDREGNISLLQERRMDLRAVVSLSESSFVLLGTDKESRTDQRGIAWWFSTERPSGQIIPTPRNAPCTKDGADETGLRFGASLGGGDFVALTSEGFLVLGRTAVDENGDLQAPELSCWVQEDPDAPLPYVGADGGFLVEQTYRMEADGRRVFWFVRNEDEELRTLILDVGDFEVTGDGGLRASLQVREATVSDPDSNASDPGAPFDDNWLAVFSWEDEPGVPTTRILTSSTTYAVDEDGQLSDPKPFGRPSGDTGEPGEHPLPLFDTEIQGGVSSVWVDSDGRMVVLTGPGEVLRGDPDQGELRSTRPLDPETFGISAIAPWREGFLALRDKKRDPLFVAPSCDARWEAVPAPRLQAKIGPRHAAPAADGGLWVVTAEEPDEPDEREEWLHRVGPDLVPVQSWNLKVPGEWLPVPVSLFDGNVQLWTWVEVAEGRLLALSRPRAADGSDRLLDIELHPDGRALARDVPLPPAVRPVTAEARTRWRDLDAAHGVAWAVGEVVEPTGPLGSTTLPRILRLVPRQNAFGDPDGFQVSDLFAELPGDEPLPPGRRFRERDFPHPQVVDVQCSDDVVVVASENFSDPSSEIFHSAYRFTGDAMGPRFELLPEFDPPRQAESLDRFPDNIDTASAVAGPERRWFLFGGNAFSRNTKVLAEGLPRTVLPFTLDHVVTAHGVTLVLGRGGRLAILQPAP